MQGVPRMRNGLPLRMQVLQDACAHLLQQEYTT